MTQLEKVLKKRKELELQEDILHKQEFICITLECELNSLVNDLTEEQTEDYFND